MNQLNRSKNKDSKLTCLYTNCDYGLENKLDELQIQVLEKEPDIVALTEVVPKNIQHNKEDRASLIPSYQLPNYVLYHNIDDLEGRGICVYVKSSLCANEVVINQAFEENVWIEVKIDNKYLKIGCVYRSPSGTSEEEHIKLRNHIKEASQGTEECLIVGDFNYPTIDWEQNKATGPIGAREFLEFISDELFIQHQTEATRRRGDNEPNTLDLVITKYDESIAIIEQEGPLGKGDHDIIFIKTNIVKKQTVRKENKLNLHKGDYEMLKRHMDQEWIEILQDKDTIQSWTIFKEKLDEGMSNCIPKIPEGVKVKPMWMNSETLEFVKKKQTAWKDLLKAKSEKRSKEEIDELVRLYNRLSNLSRWATRKATKEFETKIARNAKENPKAFWRYTKQKINVKSSVPDLIDPSTGRKTQCTKEQVDVLNAYYSSVFTDENLAKIPSVDQRTKSNKTIEWIEFTEEVVEKKLKGINPNKATGPDSIPGRVLKEISEVIAKPLCIIYQKSLNEHKLPEEWLSGEISPIYKGKGAKNDPSNYRPVSLTALICKGMEDIIRDEVVPFLTETEFITEVQYAFIKGRSCVSQLIVVLDDWTRILDEDGNIDVIYTDFKKAYDSVPHIRLMKKVENAGIRGSVLGWIEAFLSDRKQRVKIGSTKSEWAEVKSGIPQGTVLGALLFLIYINDLPEKVKSAIIKLFADDAKIYKHIQDAADGDSLQEDINAACEWTDDWQLLFHPDKCKVLRLGKSNNKQMYTIRDQDGRTHNVNESDGEKDLGVIIDSKLKFEQHVNKKVAKANSILGIIKRSFKNLDSETFRFLYKALVRPILEYGQPAWTPFYEREADTLEAVQRRATCLVASIKDQPYCDRLRHLKLPTLKHRRFRGDMIYTYKILTNQIYTDKPILELKKDSVTRGHKFKLEKPRVETTLRQKFFTNRVIEPWNKLPASIIDAPSTNAFKNRFDAAWSTDEIYEYKGH